MVTKPQALVSNAPKELGGEAIPAPATKEVGEISEEDSDVNPAVGKEFPDTDQVPTPDQKVAKPTPAPAQPVAVTQSTP